ncbi:hypothetical protein AgCh_037399 [Apium graveolens]
MSCLILIFLRACTVNNEEGAPEAQLSLVHLEVFPAEVAEGTYIMALSWLNCGPKVPWITMKYGKLFVEQRNAKWYLAVKKKRLMKQQRKESYLQGWMKLSAEILFMQNPPKNVTTDTSGLTQTSANRSLLSRMLAADLPLTAPSAMSINPKQLYRGLV